MSDRQVVRDALAGRKPLLGLQRHLEHYGIVSASVATDATIDYTVALQDAIDNTDGLLLFSGWVKVTSQINLNTKCKLHCVGGREAGGLRVESDFTLTDAGVLVTPSGEGCEIGDIGFSFDQSSAASSGDRADIVQYPPAISLGGARVTIEAVQVKGGYDGIIGDSNCGGSRFGILELGCFGTNLRIDGALDFVHVDSMEVWPFGFAGTANLLNIYTDGDAAALALKLIDCDGWVCDKCSVFKTKVDIAPSAQGILPFTFNSMQLDGDEARLVISQGRVRIGQFYSTKGTAQTDPTIDVSGGITSISHVNIAGGESVAIDVTGGELSIHGGEIYINSLSKQAATVSAGTLALHNLRLNWASGTRTDDFIEQSSTGVLIMQGCTPTLLTAQTVVKVAADVAGSFVDMRPLDPHTFTFPSGTLGNGQYYTNRKATNIVLNCATPGDLSNAYGVRSLYWQLDGEFLRYHFRLVVTPTFSTASGQLYLEVSGLPTAAIVTDTPVGGFQGVTFTSTRDQLMLRHTTTAGRFTLLEYGAAANLANVNISNLSSGTQFQFFTEGAFLLR